MRTSVLIVRNIKTDAYSRACLNSDDNADIDPRRLSTRGLRFVPSHKVTSRPVLSDFSVDKPRETTEPDTIVSDDRWMRVKRGQVSEARVIPLEYVDRLHALDEQIEQLYSKTRRVAAEAWRRGRSLKVSDVTNAAQ